MHMHAGEELRRYLDELGYQHARFYIAAHTLVLHRSVNCTTLALALLVQMEDEGFNVKDLRTRHVPLPLRLCLAHQGAVWKLAWQPFHVWLTYWQQVSKTTADTFIEVATRHGLLRAQSLSEVVAESERTHTSYGCCERCVKTTRMCSAAC